MSPALNRPQVTDASKNIIEYEGSNFLRARLVLATLSGRAIRIRKIRTKEENPGLNEAEASLIRLFDKISNGCKFEVSETGTTLYYQPGTFILFTRFRFQGFIKEVPPKILI